MTKKIVLSALLLLTCVVARAENIIPAEPSESTMLGTLKIGSLTVFLETEAEMVPGTYCPKFMRPTLIIETNTNRYIGQSCWGLTTSPKSIAVTTGNQIHIAPTFEIQVFPEYSKWLALALKNLELP